MRPEPDEPRPFAPNRILEVTPEFLEAVLGQVGEANLDVVTLDEATARLARGEGKRFVCFTFDDGYRDNFQYAYPMFKARGLPFTVYIPMKYPDGHGELWWLALEQAVAKSDDEITLSRDGTPWRLPTRSVADKEKTFEAIYWWLRAIDEGKQQRAIRALAEANDIDLAAQCRDLIMTWAEIRTMAADPLVTIGAHTKDHYAIAKLSEADAMDQMVGSADRIAQKLGSRPVHFAYPYDDPGSAGPRDFALARKAGFKTAVTTRNGMLFAGHAEHLTALPRVSLNGDYQSLTYTALYLSGAPFALWNKFQQVNAA